MMRSAASTRSAMAAAKSEEPRSGALQVEVSRVKLRQVSGDRRSRMTEPADRADLASAGTDPTRSLRCNAARAAAAGRDIARSLGDALHERSSEIIGST